MSVTTEKPAGATTVRPFEVNVPEADLADLRRRCRDPVARPTEVGWGLERIGRAWDVLMKRLGTLATSRRAAIGEGAWSR